ncbi:MAG: SDR family oxidoreductase [Bacteroidales bacterium]|nr:SDR family oxidoreductase [Bacteroidales bacterium]
MDFKDKVIVITGASSGIGRALLYEFSRLGGKVVAGARSIDKLEQIQKDLEKSGIEILPVKVDVSDELQCKNLIDSAINKHGKIDVLINNAGISMRALFKDVQLKVIKQVMDVNFWGTVYCSKYAFPYLLESKGSLVGVSSIAGYKGLPGRTAYSSSKFAIHGILEVIRTENIKTGLHVLIACPGFTSSNIRNTALAADGSQQGESPRDEKKMMSPELVAHKIARAVYLRKRRLTLTTQGKLTVIINKIFPTLIDKLIYKHFAKEPDSPLN